MNDKSQNPAETSEVGRALECGDLSPLSSATDLSVANTGCAPRLDFFKKAWPRAPVHKLSEHGIYFVTAGTLNKERLFTDATRLDLLESKLLELATQYHWQIEAWAVFANHYHFVARGFPDSANLGKYLKHLHADTARALNRLDTKAGRQVWHNFWDSRLTFEKSYFARLNYVHQNAVKHRLVRVANQYPSCSAAWFERVATPAMVQTIYSFKTDQVEVQDDF
jgi:REP-associated tyrosine transposase